MTASRYQSIFAPDLFRGQTIVVTGGGSGIGRCTAHELAALGAHVVLVGRKEGKLQTVAAEIAQDGGSASWQVCDIRDEAGVQAMVKQVVAEYGAIAALVNNAGGQYITPLAQISAKGWEAVLNTNLTGGFLVARECFVQSMQQHGGAIVNIVADMWGSMPGMGHSGAARAGMVSFTETAAFEWAASGVRVNAVAPGYIASSGMDHYPPEAAALLKSMPKTVPLGRYGTEAETSAAIVFLLSPPPVSSAAACCAWMAPARRCAWAGRWPCPMARPSSAPPFGRFRAFIAAARPRCLPSLMRQHQAVKRQKSHKSGGSTCIPRPEVMVIHPQPELHSHDPF